MIEVKELCERYRKLNVPAVSDQLDKNGYWNQIMKYDIRPLKLEHKISGPAFTMFGNASHDLNKANHLIVNAIDALEPHCIALLATNGDVHTGHWGELLTNAAIYHGVGGAVIDGGIRDTKQIMKLDFPMFHRYFSPGDARGRFNVEEYQTPTIVGGVKVNPGDFILGDCDGIVVIPKEVTEDILVEAEKTATVEDEIRSRILKGEKVADLYQQYDQF